MKWDVLPGGIGGIQYYNICGVPWEAMNYYDAAAFCNLLTELYNKYKGTSYRCVYFDKSGEEFRNAKKYENHASVDFAVTPGGDRIKEEDLLEVRHENNGFRLPYSDEWEYFAKVITNESLLPLNETDVMEEFFLKKTENPSTYGFKLKNYYAKSNVLSGLWLYNIAMDNSSLREGERDEYIDISGKEKKV